MTVIFVTDGGPEAGMGHIYECLTLVGYLDEAIDFEIMLHRAGPAADLLRSRGNDPFVATNRAALCSRLERLGADTVVLNHPDVSDTFLSAIANNAGDAKIVLFGNVPIQIPAESDAYVDVIVDYSKFLTEFRSRMRTRNGTRYYEGPAYLLFREEFYEYEAAWRPDGAVEHVLVQFGASDPSNHTTWALSELAQSGWPYDLEIVLGPGFAHDEALASALADAPAGAVTCHRNADRIAKRMRRCDVLLTSPGMTAFEGLFVGCPVVAIYQTAAHKHTYQNVDFAFDRGDIDALEEHLERAYNRANQRGFVRQIGSGKDRILQEIEGPVTN